MKKIILIFLFVYPMFSFASTELRMVFPKTEIRQGTIQKVELLFSEDFAQKAEMQKTQGQKLGDFFYLYSLGPIIKKNGHEDFTSLAKIIIISEPKGNEQQAKINDEPVVLKWGLINFKKVDAPSSLLSADFSVPKITKTSIYFITLLLLSLLGFIGFRIRQKVLIKRNRETKKKEFFNTMLNASSYTEIVNVWKSKSNAIKLNPSLELLFSELELVLFKSQFKPGQTLEEEKEASVAYAAFCKKAKEIINGI